ncbi:hypothetical protein BC826DRAFT_591713 [Russula brevipes]|nr:hypothetical protein BC826DRAFT_591713 [Russula brevipes]
MLYLRLPLRSPSALLYRLVASYMMLSCSVRRVWTIMAMDHHHQWACKGLKEGCIRGPVIRRSWEGQKGADGRRRRSVLVVDEMMTLPFEESSARDN